MNPPYTPCRLNCPTTDYRIKSEFARKSYVERLIRWIETIQAANTSPFAHNGKTYSQKLKESLFTSEGVGTEGPFDDVGLQYPTVLLRMLQEYSILREIVAGASAGVTGTVLGFPLDRYQLIL